MRLAQCQIRASTVTSEAQLDYPGAGAQPRRITAPRPNWGPPQTGVVAVLHPENCRVGVYSAVDTRCGLLMLPTARRAGGRVRPLISANPGSDRVGPS